MLNLIRSVIRYFLIAVLFVCAISVVGAWTGQYHWTLDLAAQFLLPVVIIACCVAVVAGLAQLTGVGAGALAIAILASVNAGPWTAPSQTANPTVPKFSVMLFNVWYRNASVDRIAAAIRSKNPDLVVLVEATPRIRDGLRSIIDSYAYHADCLDHSACGFLVFSRSRLQPKDIQVGGSASMVLSASPAGCNMSLVLVHLTRPYPFDSPQAQRVQANAMGSEVAAWQGAKLVLGDFNAAPWGYVMQTIAAKGGVSLLTGSGGTWPSVLPKQMRIPIDHMLAGPGLQFVGREVMGAAGSDHVPLFAEIAVTDASQCARSN